MRNSSSHAYTLSYPSKEEALALQGTIGFSFHFISICLFLKLCVALAQKKYNHLRWIILMYVCISTWPHILLTSILDVILELNFTSHNRVVILSRNENCNFSINRIFNYLIIWFYCMYFTYLEWNVKIRIN